MHKPIVFMFSGQGSHYYQMGRELYFSNYYFSHWMRKLDEVIKDSNHFSIIKILYESNNKKSDLFNRTLYTSPALFMVQYSLAQVLISDNITPDYVLGSSLGEFVAAAIAGVVSYEEALYLVIKQAMILEENTEQGGMIAILDNPDKFYETPVLYNNSEIASINYDTHYIIAGDYESIVKIEDYYKTHNIIHQTLAVSYGFHSAAIDTSKMKYLALLKDRGYKNSALPIISCAYASILQHIDGNYFWDIIRKQISFKETVVSLEAKGEYIYLDLGPSGTLKGFVGNLLNKNSMSKCVSVLTPFGTDLHNLDKAKQQIDSECVNSSSSTSVQ